MKIRAISIRDYIDSAPGEIIPKLDKLHKCIPDAAPGAEESIKWGMPAYSYKRILVSFSIFRNHIGFYTTPSVIRVFSKKLYHYKTGNEPVQLPVNQELPMLLIHDMI